MPNSKMPSQAYLTSRLSYDQTTGHLYWLECSEMSRHWNSRWAGKPAFTTIERGYRQGRLDGRLYYAHRIIWKMIHNDDPPDIDHLNGVRFDNRQENLRASTRAENMRNRALSRNNSSGACGVRQAYWGAWQAYIYDGGKPLCLGSFPTKDAAIAARKNAESNLGYSDRHGRVKAV